MQTKLQMNATKKIYKYAENIESKGTDVDSTKPHLII